MKLIEKLIPHFKNRQDNYKVFTLGKPTAKVILAEIRMTSTS